MELYDWLLFLHVLAAFAAVGSVVVFGVMLAADRPRTGHGDRPALGLLTVGRRLWDVGGTGTLVLGVALAVHVDAYELLDGWILAAVALWAVAAYAAVRIGAAFGAEDGGDGRAGLMYGLMAVAVAALLVVMIYKPGA